MLSNIDVYNLEKLIGKINLIDIRSIEKYNSSHINTSINIPSDLLISNYMKYLNKDNIYYLYCSTGITSSKACNFLYNKGYKVINVIGGYYAWLLK